MACIYNPLDPIQSPYKYFYSNGTLVKQGYLVNVSGYKDAICIYETEACQDSTFQDACCVLSESVDNISSSVWIYPLIAFAVPYAALIYWKIRMRRGGAHSSQSNIWTAVLAKMSPCVRYLFFGFFIISIASMVIVNAVMPKSIQQTLTPTDRASQSAMDAFLTPVEEIFAFIEDTMTVKVGYAIASKRYDELNILLNVSIIGGLLSAAIAFLAMLCITFNDSLAGLVLNPSESSNQALIDNGCTFIPSTNELLRNAKVYWILSTVTWIPSFMSKGLGGFFVGIVELFPYMFPGIINAIVPISVWFGLLNNTDIYPLTILAIANSASTWIVAIMYFLYLGLYKNIRAKYKLRCLCHKMLPSCFACFEKNKNHVGDTSSTTNGASSKPSLIRKLVIECITEGFQLMLVDVAVQLSATITTYLAASKHFEIAFKVVAPQAAYWNFGPQYLVGAMFIFKMMGSNLIANGKHKLFVRFFGFVSILTLSLGIAAVIAATNLGRYVAYEYGSAACIYAAKQECGTSYASIFAGKDDLHSVFAAFGPTVGLNLLFVLLRGGLMVCHDFEFLAKSAVASLFLVYVPAIIVAHFYLKSSVSYYIALYLPHFALILVFGWRMFRHLKNLANGTDGPWVLHTRKMSSFTEVGIGDEGNVHSDRNSLNTSLLDSTNVTGED